MGKRVLYAVREFRADSQYSKSLGQKLRPRRRAEKVCKRLSQQGRECFLVKLIVHS